MNTDWNAYFKTKYAPETVADICQDLLSDDSVDPGSVENILLMDMVSEIACKIKCDEDGPKNISVFVKSADQYFNEIPINRTGQFKSFRRAMTSGHLAQQTIDRLASQSATNSVISNAVDNGNDPVGMSVYTVPLGFDDHIRTANTKPGFLSRLLGKSR